MTLALDLALVQRTHLRGEAVMALLVFKNLGDRPVSLAGASGVHPLFVARGPASARVEMVPESDTRRDIAPGTAAGGFHDVNAGGALAGEGTYELVAELAVGDETVPSNAVEVVIDAPSLSEPRVTIGPRVDFSTGSLVTLHRGARFNAVVAFPIATDPRSAHGLVLRPPRTLAEIHASARSPIAPHRGAITPGDKPIWAAVWLEDGALGATTHAHMAPPTRLPLDTAAVTLLGGHILEDETLVVLLLDVAADELVACSFAPPPRKREATATVEWRRPLDCGAVEGGFAVEGHSAHLLLTGPLSWVHARVDERGAAALTPIDLPHCRSVGGGAAVTVRDGEPRGVAFVETDEAVRVAEWRNGVVVLSSPPGHSSHQNAHLTFGDDGWLVFQGTSPVVSAHGHHYRVELGEVPRLVPVQPLERV